MYHQQQQQTWQQIIINQLNDSQECDISMICGKFLQYHFANQIKNSFEENDEDDYEKTYIKY